MEGNICETSLKKEKGAISQERKNPNWQSGFEKRKRERDEVGWLT